jgi:protein-disulfide isomerase
MRDLTKPKRSKQKHNHVFLLLLIAVAIFFIILTVKIFAQSSQIQNITQTTKQTATTPTQTIDQATLNELALTQYTPEQKKLIEGTNNYQIGSKDPKITIVEFGDFNCEFCRDSAPKLTALVAQYKQDVQIIWRDRPAFANSIALSLAAYCAGEQDRFWEMHDKLYANQSANLGINNQGLVPLAQQINGINIDQFSQCLNTQKYLTNIKKNLVDAEDLGVNGTPYFFVNGHPLVGDQTLETWQSIIQELLK